MADTSTMQQAIMGANTPGQSSITQTGFLQSPNVLFQAMNQQSLTNLKSLSAGSVGTYLQSKNIVNGNMASIINASLDYVLGGNSQGLPAISGNVKYSSSKRTFIPIILKTDFLFNLNPKSTAGTNNQPVPLYIVFDSTPEDITLQKTANWNAVNFLGRPEPVWTYQNSSPITFALTGKFYAESVQAHGKLLKLSDYIMSLATPSENNYMPSPVTVFIGTWKVLHCIVNNVSIKYSGPWSLQVNQDDVNRASSTAEKNVINNAIIDQNNSNIPTHAPYLFEATFNFTVVSPGNNVQYAEQVVSNNGGVNNGQELSKDDMNSPVLQSMLTFNLNEIDTDVNTGLYQNTAFTAYTFEGGQLNTYTDSSLSYTTAAQNLNIYDNANSVKRLSDQGVITNAISSQMLSLFQKANPSSTQTPQTTTSLNPFKKLF